MKGKVIIDLNDFNELVEKSKTLEKIKTTISDAVEIKEEAVEIKEEIAEITANFMVDVKKLEDLIRQYALYNKSEKYDWINPFSDSVHITFF